MEKIGGSPEMENNIETDVIVVDKRNPIQKIWSKHKKLIMIGGALVIGYYGYKKFIKK
jgi:hypothetical protein